jgi:RND family efflux transporter MFP subunit
MRRYPPILLAATVLAVLSGCQQQAPPSAALPPLVRAHQVSVAPDAGLELAGSFAAEQRVRLGFKQGGVIAALDVEEGQHVSRGQLVGQLDDADARAALRTAQAARDKAQRDAERAKRLAGQGAVPSSLRDDTESQLEAAEARLAQARDALERTHLTTPVAGTVFLRLAEPGETVGSGNPVLVIDSSGRLVARAGATERELAALKVGAAATLVLVDGTTLPGRVTSVATTPNAEDGLYAVEATPQAQKQRALLPGESVKLRFARALSGGVVRIPLEALVNRRDRDFVFVLEAAGSSARVRLAPVTVAHVEGTTIVLREGLRGGERIVAEGAYFLQDGQAVRVLE